MIFGWALLCQVSELLCSGPLLLSTDCFSYSISIKYRLHSYCVITIGPTDNALLMLTFKLLVFLLNDRCKNSTSVTFL